MDDAADVISYEEYYPFGNSSYQAGRSAAEVSLKRYRYVGKERDDESGLYYIGARYYCPWLARWLEPDPINNEWYNITQGNPGRNIERQFVELTASSYEYCYANPVRFTDPSGEQVPPRERESDSFTKNMAEGAARGAQDSLEPQAKPLTKPRQELVILKTDVNGKGYMGPESQVNANVKGANAAHYDMVGEHARGGLGGSIGYAVGGEQGAAIGSQFDNVLLGLHFSKMSRASEPSKAERAASLLEPEVKSAEFKGGEFNTLNDPRAYELKSKPMVLGKGWTVSQSKFDYFFGKVTSEGNTTRAAQNLKDLTSLGIKNEIQLTGAFNAAFEHGTVEKVSSTEHGTTVTRSITIGDKGKINVGFFYPNGDMQSIPRVTTIIPQIFNTKKR